MFEIVLIILLILVLIGALGPWGANFRVPGLTLGGLLLIILVAWLVTGGVG